jgi:hypothetical protein
MMVLTVVQTSCGSPVICALLFGNKPYEILMGSHGFPLIKLPRIGRAPITYVAKISSQDAAQNETPSSKSAQPSNLIVKGPIVKHYRTPTPKEKPGPAVHAKNKGYRVRKRRNQERKSLRPRG